MEMKVPLPGCTPRSYKTTNLSQGLNRANLIVDVHDRHQCSLRSQGFLDILNPDHTIRIHRQVGHLPAFGFQKPAGIEYRRMFKF